MGLGVAVTFVERINAALKQPRRPDGVYVHRIGASSGGKTRVVLREPTLRQIGPGLFKIMKGT